MAALVSGLVGVVLAFGGTGGAGAVPDDSQALAERFAPVVRLVDQAEECGPGEPYVPSDVDAFLGNRDVALRGPWATDDLIKIGPTGNDLASASSGDYLDFPGNPLKPGCDYEKWARAVLAGRTPVVYAHVASEQGRLALQYWFYYPFNDYNNKHESDWEMVQLEFAAPDAAGALRQDPVRIGFSQHEGVELADWDDPKLEVVDGSHPVVHVAAGSHANYFDSALFLGRSGQQGFGCDDTREPASDLRPTVKVVSGQATPWIAYQGHWGQREQAFYNGPTGPAAKTQWSKPITWSEEEGRDVSYAVPAGGLLGSGATDFFCDAVGGGSTVVRVLADNPVPVLVATAVVLILLVYRLSRVTWRPSAPLRVTRRRAWGQTITAAGRMYRSRLPLFVGIGLLTVPVSLLAAVLQRVVVGAPEVAGVAPGGEAGGWRVTVAALLTFALLGFGIVLVYGATALALAELDLGRAVGVRRAYALALERWVPLLAAFALSSVVVAVLGLSVILLPVALVLQVLFAFYTQTVMLEGRSTFDALRRSAVLVRHGFWKVASLLLVSIAVAAAVGPLLGALLLLTTKAPFPAVNVVAGVSYAVLMPFVALTMTYAYFDSVVRHASASPAPRELPEDTANPYRTRT